MRRLIFTRMAVVMSAWALGAINVSAADSWPGWRGPTSNGVADDASYGAELAPEVWRVSLSGKGGSTPAVSGEHVFVTAVEGDDNLVICISMQGAKKWTTKVGKQVAGKHRKGTSCNPSPTTDGEFVFAYFKSGDFVCLTFDGKIQWQTNIHKVHGEDQLWWDLGTSPVLTKEHVVVTCMQTGPSYLVAYEKATGKQAWKVARDLGAPSEAAQSYSTPVVVTHEGVEQLIVLGADHVTAHAASNGKELWRFGGLNPTSHQYFRSISGPVVHEGVVIAPYARGDSVTAVKLGGTGDVTESHKAWFHQGMGADVPTPTAKDGLTYICSDKGEVSCVDVKSGEIFWRERVDKHKSGFSASPILADGKVFVTREDGAIFSLRQGKQYELLGTSSVDQFTVATPVLVGGKVLIRTFDSLACYSP
jgi:outer membrane protein assembly factor BamB